MSDSQVYAMTCWCNDVMTNAPGTHDRGCDEVVRLRAALATSQADVARLAAELAESVRALAVSQGEVERLNNQIFGARANSRAANAECAATMADMGRLHGNLDRARGLLGRLDTIYERGLSTDGQMYELVGVFRDARAFLSPPAPTDSPACPSCGVRGNDHRPDCGAGPEVTVKETSK